jgi:hypothetical protein
MYTTRKPPRPRERRTPLALTEIPPEALQWLGMLAIPWLECYRAALREMREERT